MAALPADHGRLDPMGCRRARGPTVVFIAGYGDSGPGHWQRLWHVAMPGSVWIEQREWEAPDHDAWVAALEDQTRHLGGPLILVSHSLGCLVVAALDRSGSLARRVAGALLVAPPDPLGPAFPPAIRGFARPITTALPFPAIVVASGNDPYATSAWTRATAGAWRARLVEIGPRGHINASSGLGDWPEGRALLATLLDG